MIRIRNLHKSLNGQAVLQGIDLEIHDGETLAILGKSGSGKTVLLKHIVGLLKPDRGSIWVDDREVPKLRRSELFRLRRKFGYVFQASALFDSLTVYENLALALRDRGYPETEIEEKIHQILELMGLQGNEEKYPSELSGGMQKRVSVARALITDPKYLLYDEPTAGLDPVTAETINDLMLSLKSRFRVTAVLVTHDLRCALRVADRIALLSGGKIRIVVPAEETLKIKDPELQEFFRSLEFRA